MIILRRLLLIVFLVGLYTNLGLVIAGTYVAGLIPGLAGLALLAANLAGRGGSQNLLSAAGIGIASALWVLTIPFSPDLAGFGFEHFRSLALLILASLASFGAFLEVTTYRRETVLKACIWIAGSILVLAVLEVYTPFRAVSEWVRSTLYAGRYIYSADLRDVLISGAIRPKVFTQEPSHVAKAVGVALAGAMILSRNPNRYFIGGAAWLFAFYLIGSPTLLLTVGAVFAAHVFSRPVLGVGGAMWRVVVVFAPVLAFMFLQDLAALLPFARAQMISSGQDVSFLTRSIGPAMIALETIKTYPIAGAGIGGRELVMDIVLQVYQQFPGYWLGRLTRNEGYAGWGNAFFEIFTYAGIVMSAILLPIMLLALRAMNASILLIVLIFFLVFNFDAGFVTARPWCYFGLLMALIAVSQKPEGLKRAVA